MTYLSRFFTGRRTRKLAVSGLAVGALLVMSITTPVVSAHAQTVATRTSRHTVTSAAAKEKKLKPCHSSTTGANSKCGTLKICKVAGIGVTVGTPFTFDVPTTSGIVAVVVPAGPAPGGYCNVVGTYTRGGYETTEVIPAGDSVTSITGIPAGTANLAAGTFTGTLGVGVTEVTYTDVNTSDYKETGYLEICKDVTASPVAPPAQFAFTVDGQTVDVPTNACSPALEVPTGSETVTETPVSGYSMTTCSTIPAANLVSCNPSGNTATVTVSTGGVPAETILTITNGLTSTTVTTPDSWSTSVASGTTTVSGQDPNTSLCEFPTDADTEYGSGGPSAYPNNLINSDLGPDGTPSGGCVAGSPTNAYVVTSGGVSGDGTPIAGTKWVAPNASGVSGPTASTCPPGNVPSGEGSCNFYVYDATFYLPDSLAGCSNLQISGSMLADNQAGVFLNGNYIASQPGAPDSWDGENPPGSNTNTPFAFTSPVPISDFNVSGTNTIDFVVWDATYPDTGLDYKTTISESGCPISSGPLGSSFDDSATVTGSAAGGSPTGNVTFTVCGPLAAPAPALPCTATESPVGGAVALTAGASDTSTADSASFTPTSPGYWCFDGTYGGGNGYNASSDDSTDECVLVTGSAGPKCTTVTGAAGGATTLSGCDDTANTGGSGITSFGSPSGTITWTNGETTTYTETTSEESSGQCPAGDTEIFLTITVTGGSSTSILAGSMGVSDLCETGSGVISLLSGTTFNV